MDRQDKNVSPARTGKRRHRQGDHKGHPYITSDVSTSASANGRTTEHDFRPKMDGGLAKHLLARRTFLWRIRLPPASQPEPPLPYPSTIARKSRLSRSRASITVSPQLMSGPGDPFQRAAGPNRT